jgi:ATP-dependent DNA helicase RecQ
VPSAERPEQVAVFAEALAAQLGLPFQSVVTLAGPHKAQSEMEDSAQQLRNVHGAFAVAGALPSGPVVLVDDTVDSGWTLTVVGAALREAGSGPVHPFALAKTGG